MNLQVFPTKFVSVTKTFDEKCNGHDTSNLREIGQMWEAIAWKSKDDS